MTKDKTKIHRPIIVMGVCGCGKSTIGRRLARNLRAPFIEGDDLHPEANVAKMAGGTPLVDDDRWPWLDRIASTLNEASAGGTGAVASCSALRRVYRERLAAGLDIPPLFLLLDAPADVIKSRMETRPDHFMPASLLESQLATLEHPQGTGIDRFVVTIDVSNTIDAAISAALKAIHSPANAAPSEIIKAAK